MPCYITVQTIELTDASLDELQEAFERLDQPVRRRGSSLVVDGVKFFEDSRGTSVQEPQKAAAKRLLNDALPYVAQARYLRQAQLEGWRVVEQHDDESGEIILTLER